MRRHRTLGKRLDLLAFLDECAAHENATRPGCRSSITQHSGTTAEAGQDARRGLCYAGKRGEIGGVINPRINLSQAAKLSRNAGPPPVLVGGGIVFGSGIGLVARFSQIEGYRCLSLIRALGVVNCQLALVWLALRSCSQAAISSMRVCLSGMRRSRHWDDRTPSSDSAKSSQLPCFGV